MRRILRDCLSALKLLWQDELTYSASALTFTTLLSLVPMITVFVYLMTHFYAFLRFNRIVKQFVVDNFIPNSSQEIISYLDSFANQATNLPILSILFLFATASLLMMTINGSMQRILGSKDRRNPLIRILLYPIIVLFLPIFVGLIAFLSSMVLFLMAQLPLIKALSSIVPWLINAVIFILFYMMVSSSKIHWGNTVWGGLIAAALLEAAKLIFVVYINGFSNYQAIYGALAAIPIFFIWLYIFWLIVLYGACIIKVRLRK